VDGLMGEWGKREQEKVIREKEEGRSEEGEGIREKC